MMRRLFAVLQNIRKTTVFLYYTPCLMPLKAPYKDLDYRNMIMDTYDIEAIFNEFIGVDHLNLNEFICNLKIKLEAIPWLPSSWCSVLSLLGPWVGSLVGKLRS